MKKQEKIEKIKINDVEYIRADLLQVGDGSGTEPLTLDGMNYAIVRSRNQGVMCGFVESIDGQTVKIHQARQIWRYDSTFVLPDIAEHGMRDPSKAMLSVAMSQPCVMGEACGVMYCTADAARQLIAIPAVKK